MSVERGTEPAAPRQSRVERNTRETRIVLTLNLDGTGASKIETGIPFFNHMLEAWSKHALMDLHVDAKGDLDVDLHHTVEDVGICLGKALRENSGMRIFVGQGYYDFATPFFAAEYALTRTGIPQDRVEYQYYHAGHMMYVRDEDRAKLSRDVRAFIRAR